MGHNCKLSRKLFSVYIRCTETAMMSKPIPTALYVYRCTTCGHAGQLHLAETAAELTTACTCCGAEVVAEWDGGVVLSTGKPGQPHGGSHA